MTGPTQDETGAEPVMQKIVSGLKRPAWMITSVSKIKIVVVRDTSGSMDGKKAEDAQAGINGMIDKLAGEPKNGFKIAIVDFARKAKIAHDLAYAKDLAGRVRPTIACGDDADVGLLKRLASSSQHFYRLPDVNTLRQFLPQIGVTLVHSIRHGEDVGQALASMHA